MTSRISSWWGQRTLHTRLALLVAGAVAAAVLGLAVLAWTAVTEVVQHQGESELTTDAEAIAAPPDAWLSAAVARAGNS